jgi:hypothetical protein
LEICAEEKICELLAIQKKPLYYVVDETELDVKKTMNEHLSFMYFYLRQCINY